MRRIEIYNKRRLRGYLINITRTYDIKGLTIYDVIPYFISRFPPEFIKIPKIYDSTCDSIFEKKLVITIKKVKYIFASCICFIDLKKKLVRFFHFGSGEEIVEFNDNVVLRELQSKDMERSIE